MSGEFTGVDIVCECIIFGAGEAVGSILYSQVVFMSHSLDIIPSDVLNHLILPLIPLPSLISCLFVSPRWNKIVRSFTQDSTRTISQQSIILEIIFRDGCQNLLQWYQNYLHFQPYKQKSQKLVMLAAKGYIHI